MQTNNKDEAKGQGEENSDGLPLSNFVAKKAGVRREGVRRIGIKKREVKRMIVKRVGAKRKSFRRMRMFKMKQSRKMGVIKM